MFQKLKDKVGYLAVAAPVVLMSSPAFAGDFGPAVTAGVNKISGMNEDVIAAFSGMIGVSALFWIVRKVLRICKRAGICGLSGLYWVFGRRIEYPASTQYSRPINTRIHAND